MSLASRETDDTLGQSFKSLRHIEYVQQVKSVKERLKPKTIDMDRNIIWKRQIVIVSSERG